MGDAVGSSVSLNFGTPADMGDIRGSLAISQKGSFPHGGSIIAVHQRETTCSYRIFWSDIVNTVEIHRRKPPSPSSSMAAVVSPKEISTIGWRFSEVEEKTSP